MWSAADIPDLRGRVALVTGGNSGIGYEVARELAGRRAIVVVAGRDPARIGAVAREIKGEALLLNLADLGSVRAAAEEFRDRHERLDLLVNNAGVMIPPFELTSDGFELTFGVNHLGHFAFTGLLLDRLLAAPGARVVTVSSNGHRRGVMDFENLRAEKGYDPWGAYCGSKLANLLFAFELQRRYPGLVSIGAHPGAARTPLMRHSPWHYRLAASRRTKWVMSWLIQDQLAGAQPILRAATDVAARGGEYYGPDGRGENTGRPVRVLAVEAAYDPVAQRRLWEVSERLTGVRFPVVAGMLTDGP
ncbi:oxidoreductase [Actinoplanes sp. NPDC051861]|uniref:oxidoreductase n=1 Tax=Actinoplanes sp. NPDC051861 TaxID=3155170 RepID=UPI0034133725